MILIWFFITVGYLMGFPIQLAKLDYMSNKPSMSFWRNLNLKNSVNITLI